jgi:hypothetical protein
VGRLLHAIQFHLHYQDDKGARSGRLWWYQIGYLLQGSEPLERPYSFSWDGIIFALSWFGLPALARKSKVFLLWFLFAAIFLVAWRTKWNQYALVFITPMCLSAGLALTEAFYWLRPRIAQRLDSRPKTA